MEKAKKKKRQRSALSPSATTRSLTCEEEIDWNNYRFSWLESMGKGPLSFRRLASIRHREKGSAVKDDSAQTSAPSSPPPPLPINAGGPIVGGAGKAKKKTGGARWWMRFDRTGAMEVVEYDKSTIIKRASVPARDLRILGPVFSHSSNILGKNFDLLILGHCVSEVISLFFDEYLRKS